MTFITLEYSLNSLLLQVRSHGSVDGPSIEKCIMEAVPVFHRAPLCSSNEEPIQRTLQCLICLHDGTDLIEMQKHLMQWHGLTQVDLSTAMRICRLREDGREVNHHYLWALPLHRASALGLSRLCYLHARSYETTTLHQPVSPPQGAPSPLSGGSDAPWLL